MRTLVLVGKHGPAFTPAFLPAFTHITVYAVDLFWDAIRTTKDCRIIDRSTVSIRPAISSIPGTWLPSTTTEGR